MRSVPNHIWQCLCIQIPLLSQGMERQKVLRTSTCLFILRQIIGTLKHHGMVGKSAFWPVVLQGLGDLRTWSLQTGVCIIFGGRGSGEGWAGNNNVCICCFVRCMRLHHALLFSLCSMFIVAPCRLFRAMELEVEEVLTVSLVLLHLAWVDRKPVLPHCFMFRKERWNSLGHHPKRAVAPEDLDFLFWEWKSFRWGHSHFTRKHKRPSKYWFLRTRLDTPSDRSSFLLLMLGQLRTVLHHWSSYSLAICFFFSL